MLSPVEVNRQWYEEMWNRRREELIDVLMAPDAVAHGLGPQPIQGAAGFKPFFRAFIDAAHARGIMVLLDVVYNHFGPEGNYLHGYAPDFFRADRHRPPSISAIPANVSELASAWRAAGFTGE